MAAVESVLAEDESPTVPDGSAEPRAGGGTAVRPDGSAEPPQPIAARRADALLALVAGQHPTHSPTVVIHVRADAFKSAHPDPGERPAAWIEGGPAIAPAVAERLTCGARVQALLVDRRGHPLNLGRARRTVSAAQLRALRVRDRD